MKRIVSSIAVLAASVTLTLTLAAQQAPYFPPPQLEQLVARIALYPDPLLAQVLAGATYSNQIADAAVWANQHRGQPPDQIAAEITADQVPFDPAVQALLPLPQVLDMMARDMNWTQRLGDAFLAQPNDVMDAVQRQRRHSYEYGYLRTGPHVIVNNGPFIEILPVGAGMYYVPVYDPAIVFFRPRPGFFVGGAINFGVGFAFGLAFRPWGWGVSRFGWGDHRVFVGGGAWGRNWGNRAVYSHPFGAGVYHPAPGAYRAGFRAGANAEARRGVEARPGARAAAAEHRGPVAAEHRGPAAAEHRGPAPQQHAAQQHTAPAHQAQGGAHAQPQHAAQQQHAAPAHQAPKPAAGKPAAKPKGKG